MSNVVVAASVDNVVIEDLSTFTRFQ